MGGSFESMCSRSTQAIPGISKRRAQAQIHVTKPSTVKTILPVQGVLTSAIVSPSHERPAHALNPGPMPFWPAVEFSYPILPTHSPLPLFWLPPQTSSIQIKYPQGRLKSAANVQGGPKSLHSPSSLPHVTSSSPAVTAQAPTLSISKSVQVVPLDDPVRQASLVSEVKIVVAPEGTPFSTYSHGPYTRSCPTSPCPTSGPPSPCSTSESPSLFSDSCSPSPLDLSRPPSPRPNSCPPSL
jgi:hypothetical protein